METKTPDHYDYLFEQYKDNKMDQEIELNDIETQIKISIKEIINCEFKEELEKELSYLIHLCQLYGRKGGKKDLW